MDDDAAASGTRPTTLLRETRPSRKLFWTGRMPRSKVRRVALLHVNEVNECWLGRKKMKYLSSIATGLIAVTVSLGSLHLYVKDGGNVDFYWKPMTAAWLVVTVLSFIPKMKNPFFAFVQRAWWLQIVVPVVLHYLSYRLVSVYEPYPMGYDNNPNQSLTPTRHRP